MPLYLWGDTDGSRFRESYFSYFPGVWRHGDWIQITKRGTCVIYGRSDATIKRQGVRIGTSEVYRAVESISEVTDSMAVELEGPGQEGEVVLFVTLTPGRSLDPELEAKIRGRIKTDISPRHVPDMVVEAPGIPRTLSGKKLEVPIKRILMGGDPSAVVDRDSLAEPGHIDFYVELAKRWRLERRKAGPK
jgi:acetoacetyl-CoA synthetase